VVGGRRLLAGKHLSLSSSPAPESGRSPVDFEKRTSVLSSVSVALFRCHQHTDIQIQATAIMELARVDALVNNLASLFEAGLDFYTKWKKKLERQPRKDAVSTSLDMSSHRIKATYQVGFAMIGPDFSAGDGLFITVFRSPLPD
jgi:hypothetical protein